jgi:flagellar motility protein MotE (MotC chaperone)
VSCCNGFSPVFLINGTTLFSYINERQTFCLVSKKEIANELEISRLFRQESDRDIAGKEEKGKISTV